MARHLFVHDEAKKRLGKAVKAVESRSSAEIVVAVQPWSSRWIGVDGGVGLVVAYLALLYTLFAPQVFGLVWIALIIPTGFGLGFAMSRALPGLRMGLAGAARAEAAVRKGANARFTELGVSITRGRTGMLVYVSLAERRAAVVSDVGVRTQVPKDELAAAVTRIEQAITTHGLQEAGLEALCKAVQALGPVLEGPLPRAEDDIDELEDVA